MHQHRHDEQPYREPAEAPAPAAEAEYKPPSSIIVRGPGGVELANVRGATTNLEAAESYARKTWGCPSLEAAETARIFRFDRLEFEAVP